MNFIRNGWYLATLSERLTHDPMPQVMLGEPLVLYRKASGTPVALSDRCPHRFAPLHKGKIKDDCIECPYHGLHFDSSGACAVNPHGDGKIPKAAVVRSYPLCERDGIVWAWMGDPALVDSHPAPDLSGFFGNGEMTVVADDFIVNAHYECVLDNLLDLSHAPFLHPTTLANPESIENLRFEMKQEGLTVWAYHHIPDSEPSPQFRPFRRSSAPRCNAHAHMRWDPPATLQLDVGVTEFGETEGLLLHVAHLMTPIDMHHTRYTWVSARNFAKDDVPLSQIMKQQGTHVFQTEDEPMIHDVYDNMSSPDLFDLGPVLLPGDAAGVRARRILKQLREKEAVTL